MTKKPGPGRDHRQDPDAEEESAAPSSNFKVDRVFAPTRTATREATGPTRTPPRESVAPPRTPPHESTPPPVVSRTATSNPEVGDTELSLRRQMARLQRQLSEAQLELARKEEELAAEAERRLTFGAEHLGVLATNRQLTTRIEELTAFQERMLGIERRLLDAVTTAEELSLDRDRERAQREQATARVAELTAASEEALARWNEERTALADTHAAGIAEAENSKRIALAAAEEAIVATHMRLRQANEDQLAQLRESHERSLSALRGDLEPKLLQARNLAEQHQRTVNELAEQRTAAARDAAEREEAYKRELAQLEETHNSKHTAQARLFQTALTRMQDERDAKVAAFDQAQRNAEERERLWNQTTSGLRETQKKLQIEAAEAKELGTRLATEKASAEERLAAATAACEHMIAEMRDLQTRLAASEAEARQHELDRRRFAAYLEEGLALVGALPPIETKPAAAADDDDAAITILPGTLTTDEDIG